MHVLKPIGAILQHHELPNESFVNVEVVEGLSKTTLCFAHPFDVREDKIQIDIKDLNYIVEWAQKP